MLRVQRALTSSCGCRWRVGRGQVLDDFVENPFTFVYVHSVLSKPNTPSYQFLSRVHKILPHACVVAALRAAVAAGVRVPTPHWLCAHGDVVDVVDVVGTL